MDAFDLAANLILPKLIDFIGQQKIV